MSVPLMRAAGFFAPSGFSWSVTLEADWYEETGSLVRWRVPVNARPALPSDLVPQGVNRYLGFVVVGRSVGNFINDLQLYFTSDQTEDATGSGDDLADEWEAGGTVSLVSGSASFTYNVAGQDTTDPYIFTDSAFALFGDTLFARTGDQSAVLTLSIP